MGINLKKFCKQDVTVLPDLFVGTNVFMNQNKEGLNLWYVNIYINGIMVPIQCEPRLNEARAKELEVEIWKEFQGDLNG